MAIKVLSNIVLKINNKIKENYLKLIGSRGEIFYIHLNSKTGTKLKLDISVPTVYVDHKSIQDVKIPKAIREGGFQCVSNITHGVVFEIDNGILIISRNENMNVTEKYYRYKNINLPGINEKIIPYPLIYDSLQLNWNYILKCVSKANTCLKNVHRKNYKKIINIVYSNFGKLKKDMEMFIKNTSIILNKIDNDLEKLYNISDKNDSLSFNIKLRDDIYRKIVNYESIVDIVNKIDVLQLEISKENENLVLNYANLGLFHHYKI